MRYFCTQKLEHNCALCTEWFVQYSSYHHVGVTELRMSHGPLFCIQTNWDKNDKPMSFGKGWFILKRHAFKAPADFLSSVLRELFWKWHELKGFPVCTFLNISGTSKDPLKQLAQFMWIKITCNLQSCHSSHV